jgi:hypothetical protein
LPTIPIKPCTNQIVGVVRGNQESQRTADIVGQRVDFGGLPAARAADCIVEGPLLRRLWSDGL